ncbi:MULTISPECIES: hypothetical protein [unclassified Streptomyces]|uniref:hypothetical protein n=1 Tax=unclassified Streptomyces TaxID=2593676 RepID=UPI0038307CAD
MGVMSESVPVCCPACGRERLYTAPSYPCVCGAPVAPGLDPGAPPTAVVRRVWEDEWITVPCAACGRRDVWPYPELGCPCGTVLRIAVHGERGGSTGGEGGDGGRRDPAAPGGRAPAPGGAAAPSPPSARRPVPPPVRTARDAVTAAVLYLRRLGHTGVRRADQRPVAGIGLAARGLLALVDPSAHPAGRREVECLWLTAMTDAAACVYFSLAGFSADALAHADALGVPLFVLDLDGTPQPVNATAERLDADAPGRD